MKRNADGTLDEKTVVRAPRKRVRVNPQREVPVESHAHVLPTGPRMDAVSSASTTIRDDGNTFASKHFDALAKNEKYRYFPNASKVGHAVIFSDADGHKTALQYALPRDFEPETPTVYPLSAIEETLIGGKMIRYKALGPDGKPWHSKRFLKAQVKFDEAKPIDVEIACFSEDEKEREPFWGSVGEIARFSSDAPPELMRAPVFKGGTDMDVEPDSVRYRNEHPQRSISQNKIMGDGTGDLSARDAYEDYSTRFNDYLSIDMKRILERSFRANIRVSPENQFRPEWNHADSHVLTPLSRDPQLKSNLGAAGKWVNTEMMVLERIAKWFALNHAQNTRIKIKSLFKMLNQSELIDTIKHEVHLEFNERFVRLMQDLDAFKDRPVFRKASDLAQATGISHAILHGHAPLLIESVAKVPRTAIDTTELEDSKTSDLHEETVYRQVPESLEAKTSHEEKRYTATILDLETMGMSALKDEIIEVALLHFSFTTQEGVLTVIDQYQGLQDPGKPIPPHIAKLTHIGDEIRGKKIDWDSVNDILKKSDVIFCHNSHFDRQFLEHQTPPETQELVRSKPFGCTMKDIDWKARGFPSKSLELLNQHLGFKYEGHRALNDCWATLNLLREADRAIHELMENVNTKQILLCVTDNPFNKRKLLKDRSYQWSNGSRGTIPKCWYKYVRYDGLQEEKNWLDNHIYGCEGASDAIPQHVITAIERYSVRAERVTPLEKLNTTTRHYFDARIRGAVSKNLQAKLLDVSGLSQAIELYDLSSYGYTEGRRPLFYMLARLLANPLCQTMYAARWRVFADFHDPMEPINVAFANNLIQRLSKTSEHERVAVFFNTLAELRPFPPSQKYLVDVDLEQHILNELKNYCLSSIKEIKTTEDYEKSRRMLRCLKTIGGDKTIFDAIKDAVGAAIESEDWASTRSYEQLMHQIWSVLAQPHPCLSDFKQELESSRGYQQMAIGAIQTFSPIMSSGAPTRDRATSSMHDNSVRVSEVTQSLTK
ncbi:MAG: 3'-5' exonuclease [Legionellaceae bacterium]